MSFARMQALTLLTMLAFASNSVLCRISLKQTSMDAVSFTTIRLVSGAVMLWLVVRLTRRTPSGRGNWRSAFALFAYAATLILLMRVYGSTQVDAAGVWLAVLSGALASAIGYAIWYTALPALKATSAATVQLSVPVLATLGGILFLGEAMSPRLALASVAILGGIALVILEKKSAKSVKSAQPVAKAKATAEATTPGQR